MSFQLFYDYLIFLALNLHVFQEQTICSPRFCGAYIFMTIKSLKAFTAFSFY